MNLVRILLFPIACLYGIIMSLRNKMFDWSILKSEHFRIPVISVGNLSAGGSGKTPQVEYLVRLLQTHNYKVSTLSRGYRRKTRGFVKADKTSTYFDIGDEPLQYSEKFNDITVAVDGKRTRGIKLLCNSDPELDIILLDDAYQHRYVKPGLSILLTDFHNLYINDYILPTGNLREWRKGAKRADIIIVTKTPSVLSPLTRRRLTSILKPTIDQKLYFSFISFEKPVLIPGITKQDYCKDCHTILLFCGIANPYPLQEHLKLNCSELIVMEFPDHHRYTKKDLDKIIYTYNEIFSAKKMILTTEKDVMRLIKSDLIDSLKDYPIFYTPIKTKFHKEDAAAFDKQVLAYVEENRRNNTLSDQQDKNQS